MNRIIAAALSPVLATYWIVSVLALCVAAILYGVIAPICFLLIVACEHIHGEEAQP